MNKKEELKVSYKEVGKALKAELNSVISNLEDLRTESIEGGNLEKADEYNDMLQKADAAKTLLVMIRVYDLTQTDAVQRAIEKVTQAKKDLDETLNKESLIDPEKLDKAKEVIESINKMLSKIKTELDNEKSKEKGSVVGPS